MTLTKTSVWTFLPGVLALMLVLCSCRKIGETAATGGNGSTAEKTKACFQCNGTGKMKCPDCRDGFVDCPGDCLKLTKGTWVHMDVTDHPATDLWQKFELPNGGGWTSFNQTHVGHVIKFAHGDWMDTGVCHICHGTGKVECSKCRGTGEITCNICEGEGVVPESWTAFDNPKLKNRPHQITLKNGKVLLGKPVFVFGNHTTIQTANGNVEVATSDIISESGSDVK